jgi:hypothetical protein
MYKCVVCKKKFEDTFEHLEQENNAEHKNYYDKILRNINDKGISDYRCFCGGVIQMIGGGMPDGGAWWETSCQKCGLLLDED